MAKQDEIGPAPRTMVPMTVRDVLNGHVDDLVMAFVWSDTDQGQQFWMAQHVARKLSSDGEAVLKAWLAEYDASATREIQAPPTPEAQP